MPARESGRPQVFFVYDLDPIVLFMFFFHAWKSFQPVRLRLAHGWYQITLINEMFQCSFILEKSRTAELPSADQRLPRCCGCLKIVAWRIREELLEI
jgi:hypothetical protein